MAFCCAVGAMSNAVLFGLNRYLHTCNDIKHILCLVPRYIFSLDSHGANVCLIIMTGILIVLLDVLMVISLMCY